MGAKILLSLHLNIKLLRDKCFTDKVFFLSPSGIGGATQASTSKVYQHSWKELVSCYAYEAVPNNAISAPRLTHFLFYLLRVGLTWYKIGIYCCAISVFFNLIIITKLELILLPLYYCIIFIYSTTFM